MRRTTIRSRCFAGIAALSAVGASMAVGGVRMDPVYELPRSASPRLERRADPIAALKRTASGSISLSNDPFSHFTRLAELLPSMETNADSSDPGSLSLDHGLRLGSGGTTGTIDPGVRDKANQFPTRLEAGFVNLNLYTDAMFDAPRWGN